MMRTGSSYWETIWADVSLLMNPAISLHLMLVSPTAGWTAMEALPLVPKVHELSIEEEIHAGVEPLAEGKLALLVLAQHPLHRCHRFANSWSGHRGIGTSKKSSLVTWLELGLRMRVRRWARQESSKAFCAPAPLHSSTVITQTQKEGTCVLEEFVVESLCELGPGDADFGALLQDPILPDPVFINKGS